MAALLSFYSKCRSRSSIHIDGVDVVNVKSIDSSSVVLVAIIDVASIRTMRATGLKYAFIHREPRTRQRHRTAAAG